MDKKTPPNLRLLEILDAFAKAASPATVGEITSQIGWPKQSIYRLIHTLVDEGYLEQHGRRYMPSKKLAAMANGILQFMPPLQSRNQILRQLSILSGETVNFVMPAHDGMDYIDRVDTNWPFQIQLPIGSCVPFHCTASGKTYLAHIRKTQRLNLLDSLTLKAHTAKTCICPNMLEDQLRHVRKNGYAIDDEELFDNMFAIAVPVLDNNGRYYAALAIHGPKQRFSMQQALALTDDMINAAKRISALTFGDDRGDNDSE